MVHTAALKFFVACVSLFLMVKEIQCCDYEFANLENPHSVDWSTSIESVVYTVQVNNLPANTISNDVLIQIDPPSSKFKLNEADIYNTNTYCALWKIVVGKDCNQVLVKDCLEHQQTYNVGIKIINDTSCAPGTLSLTTVSATPQFNMASTTFTAVPDESPFNLFTDAFIVEISNDNAFGGCGSFRCVSRCTNDANQNHLVSDDEKIVSARKSEITLGFMYNLEVTCLDEFDDSFVTDDHKFNADLIFVLSIPTTEPTTAATYTSTTIRSTTPEPTTITTFQSTSAKATTSESAALTTSVSTTKQTSTTSVRSVFTKKTTMSAIMSSPTTILTSTTSLPVSDTETSTIYPSTTVNREYASSTAHTISTSKTNTQKLTATSSLHKLTTAIQQSSQSLTSSTRSDSNSPSTATLSGFILTTASAANSQQVKTDFFDKPENIVTVVLPAAAFSGLAVFGIGYVIYKKVLNKSSIIPVIGL